MGNLNMTVWQEVQSTNATSADISSQMSEAFGPASIDSQDSFDFTLLFEQTIMSIGPSAIFLMVFFIRGVQLFRHRNTRVKKQALYVLKMSANGILAAVQLALVVLWAHHSSSQKEVFSLAAATLALTDSIALCILSHMEHIQSVRSSSIINIYLFFSTIFDAVQCRTLWLLPEPDDIRIVFTISVVAKVVVLVLESQGKKELLMPEYQELPPEARSGVFSRNTFWWLNPLLLQGFRFSLDPEDLYNMSPEFSGHALRLKLQYSWCRCKRNQSYALLFATCSAIKWPLLSAVFPRLCLIGFRFAQPFLINRAINYVGDQQSFPSTNKNIGYGLIGSTALIYTGLTLSNATYKHHTYRTITMFRGALSSMIFTKTLELKSDGSEDSASITLMSTDIDGIATGFESFHEIWASPIEVALGLWLLERKVGLACIAPAIIALACLFATLWLSNFMGRGRREWNQAVQKRVSATSSVLGFMKEVKILGLCEFWTSKIQSLRVDELNLSKKFRMMIVWMNLISHTSPVIAPVVTFGVYALIQKRGVGATLDVGAAFSSLSLISLLTDPLNTVFHAIPTFASSLGCFERIQEFLNCTTIADSHLKKNFQSADDGIENLPINEKDMNLLVRAAKDEVNTELIITLNNVSFGSKKDLNPIVRGIDFQILRSSLTVILGRVGSGKSTLLRGIIGEIPCREGFLHRGFCEAAYCAQVPWLLNTTLRQNVVGGSKFDFDKKWYDKIIDVCALNEDLMRLPEGDQTVVGSKGVSLSGGQKQRVALARALYSRQQVVILDDIFSGLDSCTLDHIFNRVFGPQGLQKEYGLTVIIVTHNVQHLNIADYIIVMNDDGMMMEHGKFQSLKTKQNEFLQNSPLNEDEQRNQVKSQTTATLSHAQPVSKDIIVRQNKQADALRKSGDTAVYAYYLKSVGLRDSLIMLILGMASVVCDKFPIIWLEWWVRASQKSSHKNGFYFGIYAMFAAMSLILVVLTVRHMFVQIVPKSSQRLHWILLTTVMNAPLSFTLTTDIGVTLNRFSQDMTLVDMVLPPAAFLTTIGVLNCIGGAVFIIMGAKYLAAVIPIAILILYGLQKFYLQTSRQMRFMDLEAKSPLYTHFLETIDGLTTIRAFSWQSSFQERNLYLLDASQRPYYLLYCIQRWLNLVLDLFVGGVAVLLITFAIELKSSVSAGTLGVALINVLNFNSNLADLITAWTKMETSLGAIARLKNFEMETPSSNSSNKADKTLAWSFTKALDFQNISASYRPEMPLVLDGVSLRIEQGQTVAICGRTGSGKSSLLLCLLGLLDLHSGSIVIDGTDISTIPEHIKRSHMVSIPQTSSMFPGSVRFNLSAYSDYSNSQNEKTSAISGFILDETMTLALRKVSLWETVHEHGGLDADTKEIALSAGQRQLFCLARAIVHKTQIEAAQGANTHGGIVILDEANSNVDVETSNFMQYLLRNEFTASGWTALVVTHRLESAVAADAIALLDSGRVIEFGHPNILLHNEQSSVYELFNS